MTTEETVSVARGGRSTILSRDNAPANSPINAKGQHPPFFAHPGHGLSPFRPRSVSSKFEEDFFRVRSFPPSSRSASIWAPDPSISDEDEVRFIVSNGARDIIPMRRPNAAAQCGGPMRGKHVVDKLSRGLAEAEGKCTRARKHSGN